MKMVAVESSNIKAIGFENGTLRIAFKSGSVHEHDDVPAAEHSALMTAESHGKRYNSHIKGKYAGRPYRIDEAKRSRPVMPVEPIDDQPDLNTAIRRFRGEE